MAAPRPSATIYDVARLAGVSTATVSRTLNTPHMVSPERREAVLAAVETLGFVPKADAVSRARRNLRRIGVIAPFASHPAARRRVAGIVRQARRDTEVVLYDHDSAEASASPLLSVLPVTGHLDGLIVVSLPLSTGVADRLRDRRYPTVLLDCEHDGLPSIVTDDEGGGRQVARHLLDKSHRRFAFIGEAQKQPDRESPSRRRLAGFRREVESSVDGAQGAALDEVATDVRGASRAAAALLRDPVTRPTAVFAADDVRAAGVLRAAASLGMAVPQELSVVGFDDGELAQVIGLTTVRQPLERSGALAFKALQRQMRGTGDQALPLVRVRLVRRRTSGPAPGVAPAP